MKARWGQLCIASIGAVSCGSHESARPRQCANATFVWPFVIVRPHAALDRFAYALVDVPLGASAELDARDVGGEDDRCPADLRVTATMSLPYMVATSPRVFDWAHPCGQLLYRDGHVMDYDRARPDQIPQLELFRRVIGDTAVALCMDQDGRPGAWVGGVARAGSDAIACESEFAANDPIPSLRLCSSLRIVADVPEYLESVPDFSKDPDGLDPHATGSASRR